LVGSGDIQEVVSLPSSAISRGGLRVGRAAPTSVAGTRARVDWLGRRTRRTNHREFVVMVSLGLW
jgi:hypothetical protein